MSPEAYELTPPRYRYLAEDAAHISLNRYFRKPGVMFVAASGDAGTQLLFPASSPYVLPWAGPIWRRR